NCQVFFVSQGGPGAIPLGHPCCCLLLWRSKCGNRPPTRQWFSDFFQGHAKRPEPSDPPYPIGPFSAGYPMINLRSVSLLAGRCFFLLQAHGIHAPMSGPEKPLDGATSSAHHICYTEFRSGTGPQHGNEAFHAT